MDEIMVYEKLNAIRIAPLRTRFPYSLQFTKKQIELQTSNGRIFLPVESAAAKGRKKSGGGGVIIYGWEDRDRRSPRR